MTIHPLSDDLTKLSSDELDKRYGEIMRRYSIARRMQMGQDVMYQLDIMLDGIDAERARRLAETTDDNPVVLDTDDTTRGKK